MHPDITDTKNSEIPTPAAIGRYMYKHASRLECKSEISHINTFANTGDKEMERQLEEMHKEMMEDRNKKEDAKPRQRGKQRSIFQRALGHFIKISIHNDGKITSNDENFARWGESFYSRLLGFVALGKKGFPRDIGMLDLILANEGCETIAANIRSSLKGYLEKFPITNSMEQPPMNDPMKIIPIELNMEVSQMLHLQPLPQPPLPPATA